MKRKIHFVVYEYAYSFDAKNALACAEEAALTGEYDFHKYGGRLLKTLAPVYRKNTRSGVFYVLDNRRLDWLDTVEEIKKLMR